jgi:CRISPR-associated protein Cmr1
LIWQTRPFDDWRALMRELAVVKIGLRTQFIFAMNLANSDRKITNKKGEEVGISHGQPQHRHWLSYPATNHDVSSWKRQNSRLPNSLRFKVRKTPDGKLVGVIFHVPCLPPPDFNPDRNAIQTVWQNVHHLLDELARPTTERAYRSVADAARRTQLKAQLDTLTLQRISE